MIEMIEVIPHAKETGFTARLPDIPACGEGATVDEAMADLRSALAEFIEAVGVEKAMSRLRIPSHDAFEVVF